MVVWSDGKPDLQYGSTALICATQSGHAECVRLLIDAGADKEAKDVVRVGRCFADESSCFAQFSTFFFLCTNCLFLFKLFHLRLCVHTLTPLAHNDPFLSSPVRSVYIAFSMRLWCVRFPFPRHQLFAMSRFV